MVESSSPKISKTRDGTKNNPAMFVRNVLLEEMRRNLKKRKRVTNFKIEAKRVSSRKN